MKFLCSGHRRSIRDSSLEISRLAELAAGTPRQKFDKVRHLSSVKGQFQDALILHHGTNTLTTRFHECRIGLNLDLLTNPADLKNRIEYWIGIDLKNNAGLNDVRNPGREASSL